LKITIGEKAKNAAYGRIDLLVKASDGSPLFLVEVKKPDIDIETGKDQAISYARLLLAPFAIITNGKETKLYDPFLQDAPELSKATDSRYFKNGMKIAVDGDLRYEASQIFLGYSSENFANFCKFQVQHQMTFLKGDKNEKERKYIPDLFLAPNGLEDQFHHFMEGDKKVLVIDGESGSGKTNAICYLAEAMADSYPCLFYSGTLLGRDIREAIMSDFNHNFSHEKTFVGLIKRLTTILEQQKRKMVILIDAVDEYRGNEIFLTDLFNELKENDCIKLCISVKTTRMNDFLYANGIPTLATSKEKFTCQRLEDAQLDLLLSNYGKFFSTSGEVSGELKEQCKQPFYLRILHEVYANGALPKNVAPQLLIERFLEQKLAKLPRERRTAAQVFLIRLAERMCTENTVSIGTVEAFNIIQEVAQLLDALVEHYIITKEGSKLSFYFDRIRDYLYAFQVRRWDQMQPAEFERETSALSNIVAQSSISWYSEAAPAAHREVMNRALEAKALRYIEVYDEYLSRYFQSLKVKVEPFTEGKIGLLIFKNEQTGRLVGYAFIPINEAEPRLKVEKVTSESTSDHKFEVIRRFGGPPMIHAGVLEIATYHDINRRAKEQVYEEINKLIDEKLLDEGNGILIEELMEFITDHPLELGFVSPSEHFPETFPKDFWNRVFPIDLSKFRNYHLVHLLYWLKYAIEIFNNKYRDSNPALSRFGRTTGYDLRSLTSMMSEEYPQIKRQVDNAMAVGERIEVRAALVRTPIEHILRVLDTLQRTLNVIYEPLLPFGDGPKTIHRRGAWSIGEYSSTAMMKYLKKFFEQYISEARRMARSNFPSLRSKFELFDGSPLHVIVEFDLKQHNITRGSISYTILKNQNEDQDVIEIYEESDKEIFHIEFGNFFANTIYGRKELRSHHKGVMSLLFEEEALRKWCYSAMKDELKNVIPKLQY